MVEQDALPADFVAGMKNYRSGSGTFRMNVALSALPDFTALPGSRHQPHHASGIVMAPSLRFMEDAWIDARRDGWAREPIVEMLIPSTVDDTLAPPGMHVASLFCQHFAPRLEDTSARERYVGGWSDPRAREDAADCVIATVNRYAPGFDRSVIARQIHSPLDLQNKFGLVDGDIFHGRLSLDQLFMARPMLGHADYRSPIRGLYLCGSGSHPGGGVTGLPGRNAAREILRDVRR
jgi:phytoene dehydrogenase-like protein